MFQGFDPAVVDFMWGIRFNNDRAWFEPRKEEYKALFETPMKELCRDLYAGFTDKHPDLGVVSKVSRIYRDARLHHPDPYKESLWICIRREVESWGEHPALCFEIVPEMVRYGFVLWRPRPEAMEAFRKEIAARPDKFLKLLADTEKATGMPMTFDCYKRPKPCENPEIAPFFAWKNNICCIKEEPVGEEIFQPELAERAKKLLTALLPWNEYWQSIIG